MEIRPIFSALLRNKAGLILIVLQVAITLAVVCNSVFIILERAERVGRPSGIDEANSFVVNSLGFAPNFDLRATIRDDLELIAAIPGVQAVTTTNTVPTSRGGWGLGFHSQPIEEDSGRRGESTAIYGVNEDALEAFDLELVAGRNFTEADMTDFTQETGVQSRNVIVTKALADALFPEQQAVGKPVWGLISGNEPATIVGVVDRMQQPWPTSSAVEQSTLVPMYLLDSNFSRYLVRAEPGERDRVIKEVEAAMQVSNPGRMVRDINTIESIRADSFRSDNAMMTILIATMIAMIVITGCGIVGLASFWVTRRIKQIGTRRALGARRFNIRSYFQTENGIMVVIGIALGIVLTYGFNLWLMENYNAPRLPWFYLPIGAAVVFALGQIAVLGPASRAARVSPAVATRSV